MAEHLGGYLPPIDGALDYQDDNGELPPNDPSILTSGGRRSDVEDVKLRFFGTPTTGRRAIASHELEQHLAEYDTRRTPRHLPVTSRPVGEGLGPTYERGDTSQESGRAGIATSPIFGRL